MDCQECQTTERNAEREIATLEERISTLEGELSEADKQADDFYTRYEEAAENESNLNDALDEIERVIGRAR